MRGDKRDDQVKDFLRGSKFRIAASPWAHDDLSMNRIFMQRMDRKPKWDNYLSDLKERRNQNGQNE